MSSCWARSVKPQRDHEYSLIVFVVDADLSIVLYKMQWGKSWFSLFCCRQWCPPAIVSHFDRSSLSAGCTNWLSVDGCWLLTQFCKHSVAQCPAFKTISPPTSKWHRRTHNFKVTKWERSMVAVNDAFLQHWAASQGLVKAAPTYLWTWSNDVLKAARRVFLESDWSE